MGRAFEFRKARKMKRWSAMAKTFTRIGKDIVIAVKAVSYTHLDVYKRQTIIFESSEGHKFNIAKVSMIILGILIAYFL